MTAETPRGDDRDWRCELLPNDGDETCMTHGVGRDRACEICRAQYPIPEQEAHRHREALADTGDAYTSFRGWVLACLWCEFAARGKTKRDAVALMQKHYDRTLPEGATIHD